MSDKPETVSCYGIVIVLDALGIKSQSLDETDKFLELQHVLTSKLPFELEPHHRFWKQVAEEKVKGNGSGVWPTTPEELTALLPLFLPHRVTTIGDTFVCTWQCEPNDQSITMPLIYCYEWCTQMMVKALERGFFLRGAMAIGKFKLGLPSPNPLLGAAVPTGGYTVLGPAVTDAAGWYERADWIGVIVTPSSGFFLEQLWHLPGAKRPTSEFFDRQRYFKYPVPIKTLKDPVMLWVLNWPANFMEGTEKFPMPEIVAHYFAGRPMPVGVESKYLNTFRFVEHIWSNASDALRKKRPPLEAIGKTYPLPD